MQDPNTYPQTLQGQTDLITASLSEDEDSHYFIGKAVNCIIDNKLAQQAGYKDVFAYFKATFGGKLSRPVVSRSSIVARNFTQADCEAHGVYKLYYLASYLALTDPQHGPINLLAATVQVPERDKQTHEEHMVTKVFAECSAGEIAAAVQHIKKPAASIPAADVQEINDYQNNLHEDLGEHINLKPHVKNGVTLVNLENIPLAMLPEVIRSLARTLEPAAPEQAKVS